MNENNEVKQNDISFAGQKHHIFVGIDLNRNRICISSCNNSFTATKISGRWYKGYPDFDDLMDFYIELKDKAEVEKCLLEAINAVKKQ